MRGINDETFAFSASKYNGTGGQVKIQQAVVGEENGQHLNFDSSG